MAMRSDTLPYEESGEVVARLTYIRCGPVCAVLTIPTNYGLRQQQIQPADFDDCSEKDCLPA